MEIIPSILTDSKDDLRAKVLSAQPLNVMVQVDFMDGTFVPTRSLSPDDLPDELTGMAWEAHLMVQDPRAWSQPLYLRGCRRIYWHAEVLPPNMPWPHNRSHVEHALALRLETSIDVIDQFLPLIHSVLLLTIREPGQQGQPFAEEAFEKIRQLKQRHPYLKIEVDGGVNLEQIKKLQQLGVDRVVIGSAFWKFNDPKTVLAAFRQATL